LHFLFESLIFFHEKGKISADSFKERIMQDNSMSRWLSPLMAFCLTFIIIATLAPVVGIQFERQFDFWLLWLGTMLFLALPITYLEIALAKRSKTTALNALSGLTRDADASARWRLVGWLAVIFIPFLAGAVLFNAAQLIQLQMIPDFAPHLVFLAMAVVALIGSFIPRQFLVPVTALGVIVSLITANTLGTPAASWQWTSVEFSEWGSATVLALVASGLGLGLYWQSSLPRVKAQNAVTGTVLPIWFAQLVAVIAFGFFVTNGELPVIALVISALAAAALFIQFAREQLLQRQVAVVLQWAILLIALLVWAIPEIYSALNLVLMLWGLIICLIYAIFAGWIMKISHLRKSMNFSNELFYNLWRIAVRIVLPLSILLAMVAIIRQFI